MANRLLMRYLTLGVFSLVIFTFSCNKRSDYVQLGKFNFINQTNHDITYDLSIATFNIAKNSTTIVKQAQQGTKKETDVNAYVNPILYAIGDRDFLNIKFDNTKCLRITKDSEHSPLNIRNFTPEKNNGNTYKFTYTFTETEYNRAVICP